MDLSIIILNYNTKNLLRECLRALRLARPEIKMEILVIDNDSADGSAAMVLSEFPEARLIRAPRNLGYAGGNNLGIKSAVGRYIMIMNPDILVFPGSLESFLSFMEANPGVGIAGPQLINPDGSIQYSCYRFQTPFTPLYRRTAIGLLPFGRRAVKDYLMEDFDHRSVSDVDWLLGGALLVRRSALETVGLLDENFFMYFDDTDWCRRFWENGWRVAYAPVSRFVHFHQRHSQGGVIELLRKRTARMHLLSAYSYFRKYHGKNNPRREATN